MLDLKNKKIIHTVLLILSIFFTITCDSQKSNVKKNISRPVSKQKKDNSFYMEMTSYYYEDGNESTSDPAHSPYTNNKSFSFLDLELGANVSLCYGNLNLLGSFANRYNNSKIFGVKLGLNKLGNHFRPELVCQYARLKSKNRENIVDSNFELMQFMLGVSVDYGLLTLINRTLSITAGIKDGIAILNFDTENLDSKQVTYSNVLNISGGLSFELSQYFLIGTEANYQVIFTVGDNIASTSLLVKAELRL